jgi:hypothetical protein
MNQGIAYKLKESFDAYEKPRAELTPFLSLLMVLPTSVSENDG